MRLAAVEKVAYYPTQDRIYELISTHLKTPSDFARLLDPCAGTGKAASYIAKNHHLRSYGIEISNKRAEEARQTMDEVINAPMENVTISNSSISVLFLNPPYEVIDGERLEYKFLRWMTPKLVNGGILIYIVRRKEIHDKRIVKYLLQVYERISVYEYPEPEKQDFDQVVLFATKRISSDEEIDEDAVKNWIDSHQNLPVLDTGQEEYKIPPSPIKVWGNRQFVFRMNYVSVSELMKYVEEKGATKLPRYKDIIMVEKNRSIEAISPVMPLKKGHLSMLIASGMLGNLRIETESGPMIVKGKVTKIEEEISSEEKEPKNYRYKTEEHITVRERIRTIISYIHNDKPYLITETKDLTDFMMKYGEEIGKQVMTMFKPIYNFDPAPEEIKKINRLGKNRQPLPGQKEAGLLDTQKHVAIAISRQIVKDGFSNLQGEMGLGKTTVGAAVIDMIDAFPAIVICPPQLVPKWLRELKEVIPDVQVREIVRIGKNADDPVDRNDVAAFIKDYESGLMGKKAVAVVATSSMKIGPKWRIAGILKRARSGYKALTCPVCGKGAVNKDGYLIFEEDLPNINQQIFCENNVPGWELTEDGKLARDENGNTIWGTRVCGAPIFTFDEARRVSIAEYINKYAKGFFKMLIADEVHELKGKDTDRGIAFQQISSAVKYTLTLTGTFFGGKSTSIFWLLHRLNPKIRDEFGHNEEMRWANLYGVLEKVIRSREARWGESGNQRSVIRVKEKPGISPAIIKYLLSNSVFVNLKDLGVSLPDYEETIDAIEMLFGQYNQYKKMTDDLKEEAIKNHRYLSSWLQWSLARPTSCFRNEEVILNEYDIDSMGNAKVVGQRTFMKLKAVVEGDELLPKEQWLIDLVKGEKAQGRKVLVYIRQTASRDIQERIAKVLKDSGINVEIMRSGVSPRQREEWIAKKVNSIDVLLCNPELVKTGLDLIQFSTVVFYEVIYSLYTLWQAVRRVWRLGQRKPVKAIFSCYKGSMEETAFQLMGQKMRAAQLLYGDEAGGAIVEDDDDDIITMISQKVLSGSEVEKMNLESLFVSFKPDEAVSFPKESEIISEIPVIEEIEPKPEIIIVPTPTPEQKPVVTWDSWAKTREIANTKKRGKKDPVSGQLSLF